MDKRWASLSRGRLQMRIENTRKTPEEESNSGFSKLLKRLIVLASSFSRLEAFPLNIHASISGLKLLELMFILSKSARI